MSASSKSTAIPKQARAIKPKPKKGSKANRESEECEIECDYCDKKFDNPPPQFFLSKVLNRVCRNAFIQVLKKLALHI